MKKLLIALLVCCVSVSLPVYCYQADQNVTWTESELAFIAQHPIIRLGVDPGFLPFEFLDIDGEYKGIAADYLALLSEKTGIQFDVVKGLTWPEAYDRALAGDIDVLPAISKTEEREKYFDFSTPYYHFKRVIVTRDTEKEISGIEDLFGMTVAVQRNSSHHSYLLAHSKINLSLYDSVEGALTAVANGTERAYVGNLATTNYLIRANGLTNLKFTAFEAEKQLGLHFAVRKDWPELVSILNKALATITEEEKIAIQNKWITLETESNYAHIIRIALIAGSFVVAILSVSAYWILRLKKEIAMRKLVQVDLERAKIEAEEANKFKSNFLARMSHEIRTPLNAITGMAYLLKKTSVTLTQKMYIDRITQASTNMLSIINDILDFSKIEAGKVELEITSFNLDQVIQDVVNIVSYKIEEQEIGFRLSKDPLIPNWFWGDPKRLEQILLNLLNNAAKFTDNGEVSLDIRLLAKENDLYHLAFTVKDSGIGMNEEQVKSLFVPFAQGDISINRRFGGTGLGLSIVKHFVDMMSGQIKVFSTEGEGSTFIIHLSFAIDKERDKEYKKTMSTDQFKNIRTLVLEKTGANMNLIDSYLGAFGMHCELTTSQASALSMLEAADGKFAKPFDLMIIDYETPIEGGFQYIMAIRNNNKIVKIPKIILLLPMMRDDLFDKLDECGVEIGIGKPIIPSILFNAILDIFKLKAVSSIKSSEKWRLSHAPLERPICALIVEDNKTNQLIAQSLLEQIGIEVMLAADGKTAIALYEKYKEKINLILMDLHMPLMNGYEAASQIRNISGTVPIVAMTADVVLGVKEKCEQSGINYYISKPFDPDRFILLIKDIMSKQETKNVQDFSILDECIGLRIVGGDHELYRKVLNEYFNENQETLDKLSHAILEKRYDDATQIIHKVKSSSGSIGAKPIYDLAVELQKAIQEGNETEQSFLHKEFSDLFMQLLQKIESLVKGEK